MQQPQKQYITRKDFPDAVYYGLDRIAQRHVDYLFGLLNLMQLPTFDDVHNVEYGTIPNDEGAGKGWQIISKLTPERELRLWLSSKVANPENPLYYMVYSAPTQIYDYWVDVQVGGVSRTYFSYPKAQEKNLNPKGKWMKKLSDDCLRCMKDANARQVKIGQPQKPCLQEFGYPHLGDKNQEMFRLLSEGRVSQEELVPMINMINYITSLYDKTRNG